MADLEQRLLAQVLHRLARRLHQVLQPALLRRREEVRCTTRHVSMTAARASVHSGRTEALDECARHYQLDVLQEVDVELVVGGARYGVLLKVECDEADVAGRGPLVVHHQQRRKAAVLVEQVPDAQRLQAAHYLRGAR